MSSCLLLFLSFNLFGKRSIVDGHDFLFIISAEAFNNKLLGGYVPGMNVEISQQIFPSGSSGGKGDEIHSKWSEIRISSFSPLKINNNLNAYLNPNTQTIDFIVSNLMLQSNIFNISFKYEPHPITKKNALICNGKAQILINNYNISISYYLRNSKNIIINNASDKINIDDCQLTIDIHTDSVKIGVPKNDMPLDYTFDNIFCNVIFTNDYIEGVIRKYLDFYFKSILPYRWQKQLQKSIEKLEGKQQILNLEYDNITTYDVVCYRNNSINNNGDLVVDGLFVPNGSINYNSNNYHKNISNMTAPHIDDRFGAVVVLTVTFILLIIFICCLIGCFCTVRYIMKRIGHKLKKQERRDLIEEYFALQYNE